MMETIKRVIISMTLIILMVMVTGCGNGIVNKSIEQAKTAIANREYDKALLSLELALSEDKENKEANKLYSIVESYQKSKSFIDENKIEEAKKIISEIDPEYINYEIKEDIDLLTAQIDSYNSEIQKVETYLSEGETLFNNKNYVECKVYIGTHILGLTENSIQPNKYVTEDQNKKALEIVEKCESAIVEVEAQRLEEEARLAKEKKLSEAENAKSITEQKAVELVKNYLIHNYGGVSSIVEVDSSNSEEYTVHAYNIVVDHTATIGWYYVNKKTGDIKSMF